MIAFIDDHREVHGVEPICKVLPIAPSTYHDHVARRRDPARLSIRAKRHDALRVSTRPRSSIDAVRGALWKRRVRHARWVDWFNNRRLLEPIGNIPPAEAEARYYAMLQQPAMAA
jgi:putative transposase